MTDTTTSAPAGTEVVLPPFSGDETVCAKCRNLEATVTYRQPLGRGLMDRFNGHLRRTTLPERLERQCTRCDYQWDEALPVDDHADGGLTVEQVAHTLDDTTPYPIEIRVDILRWMAARLLERVVVFPVPDHPLWQPEELAPDSVAPTDPSDLVRADDDARPAGTAPPDAEGGRHRRDPIRGARPHPLTSPDDDHPGEGGRADEGRTPRRTAVRQAITTAFLDDPAPRCSCGLTGDLLAIDPAGGHAHAVPTEERTR
ncbi:hypothetical protein ACFV27_00700 [Streptomyces antimycoticus]|uniref:hypothetical protein n=1 Tax=Streptomyces antimycoticus TaxID=68175 RepID=UPI0036AE7581